MRVQAQGDANSSERLSVSCELGNLEGIWRGSAGIRRGDVVDVELDSSGSSTWGDALVADGDATDDIFAFGTVTSVLDGGAAAVQLGSAAIVLEMAGSQPSDVVGRRIRLDMADLEFWPTGV